MATARPTPRAPKLSTGVGEITASKAANWPASRALPNPNLALDRFVVPDPVNGGMTFDGPAWYVTASADPAWDGASWHDVSWQDVSWNDVSWQDVSWSDVSWQDVSWNDVLSSESSVDVSWEDAAEGDNNSTDGVTISDSDVAQVLCDPTVNPDPLPAACTQAADSGSTDTGSTTTDQTSTDAGSTTTDPGTSTTP